MLDNIIAGRLASFEVQIIPEPINLKSSEVEFRLIQGTELKISQTAGGVIGTDTVSIIIDSYLTEPLEEGIYTYEILYTHDGLEDTVISGIIDVLRRA